MTRVSPGVASSLESESPAAPFTSPRGDAETAAVREGRSPNPAAPHAAIDGLSFASALTIVEREAIHARRRLQADDLHDDTIDLLVAVERVLRFYDVKEGAA